MSKNRNKFYAVIVARKRRETKYGLVLSHGELSKLLALRIPIFAQKRSKTEEDAALELEHLCLLDVFAKETIERTSLSGFLKGAKTGKAAEEEGFEPDTESAICFYDSEFGMYNFGEQQGDVVSMGAVVLRRFDGAELCRFQSLIRNTDEKQLSGRFEAFTGLSRKMLKAAPAFPEVFAAFKSRMEAERVSVVYCLGNNDIERLQYMLERYGMSSSDKAFLKRFCNFQKWLNKYDQRLGLFSLESLTALCHVENERQHDALSDAAALSGVYRALMKKRPETARIEAEQEAARQRNRYRKNRRISYERMEAPAEIIEAKDKLLAFLKEQNRETRVLSQTVVQAICDDLDTFFIRE